MTRDEALELVKSHIKTKNLIKHSLAVEASMRHLAKKFGEDEDLWALTGLLHDLDYDYTKDNFNEHGFKTCEILGDKVDERIIYAIKAHPGWVPRKSKLDIALYAVDPLTGLIIAACLMHPSKKLESLDADFVMRRFKEKRFAAGCKREQILECEKLGISLREFIEITLKAMQEIHDLLGL